MKFLCLHGSGTNSSVMQSQTGIEQYEPPEISPLTTAPGPLRHELGEGYEYEFGRDADNMDYEGVEALSSAGHDFYAFYDPADLATLQIAMDQLDRYIASEGPFDGVMGFSSGCVLAALYLLRKQQQQQSPALPFKCAIFLSCAEIRQELRYLGADAVRNPIRVPTAHVWGSNDATAPSGGQDLYEICDAETRLVLIHDGAHEVSRGHYLTEACHVIRRVLQRAKRTAAQAAPEAQAQAPHISATLAPSGQPAKQGKHGDRVDSMQRRPDAESSQRVQ
ncbi:serine hydrolase-domain-containing protein [Xylaria sp. FL0933]|nr:serine hydrolase-domain-containing protein [Xylaria sp. FL0933]